MNQFDLPRNNNTKIIYSILAIIVIILIIGGIFFVWGNSQQLKSPQLKSLGVDYQPKQLKKNKPSINQFNNQERQNNEELFSIISSKNFDYKLLTQYGEIWDQKLIQQDKLTKTETIIVSSIKESVPELKDQNNLLLSFFALPKDAKIIIFKSIITETDNPFGLLYSFNIENKQFTKMKINDIYNGFFGGLAISPDQTKFVWVPENEKAELGMAQMMYLIDLINDENRVIVNLKGTETFNAGLFAMNSYFKINWDNNEQINYAVYDQSKKGKDFDPFSEDDRKNIFIDSRKFFLLTPNFKAQSHFEARREDGQMILYQVSSDSGWQKTGLAVDIIDDVSVKIIVSPDKTKAVFNKWDNISLQMMIYISNIDGTDVQFLAKQEVGEGSGGMEQDSIVWSDDGQYVSYFEKQITCGETCQNPGDFVLVDVYYQVNVATGEKKIIENIELK